jgi:hypothetical protein
MVRVVEAVPAKIIDLMLGAGARRRGGLPICLIKEAVIGSSRVKVVFCLTSALTDLADDEFQKAPSTIFIGRFMHVDCWIGWDPVMCTHISGHTALGRSDLKLHYLLSSWDMSIFDFHGGGECYGG